MAAGEVSARSAGIVTAALERVGPFCDDAAVVRMEHAFTRTAADNDPDFPARVSQGWIEALNQTGSEPSEELLRQLQGAFYPQAVPRT
ncbi:hypothetical protein [Arthrobacter sp. UYEF3]|uniref:hypothetical protein n=1 Tax=Arthrobacter sp. UYEF3 TaxID=1756365 RepID=UPI003399A59F